MSSSSPTPHDEREAWIRERWDASAYRVVPRYVEDIQWLLSERDRATKVIEAARDLADATAFIAECGDHPDHLLTAEQKSRVLGEALAVYEARETM